MLTTSIAFAMWAFLPAIDEEEPKSRARLWAVTFSGQPGPRLAAQKFNSRIVFPCSAALIYLASRTNYLYATPGKRSAALQRHADRSGDRGAVAHPGDTAQSTIFLFHHSQRPG